MIETGAARGRFCLQHFRFGHSDLFRISSFVLRISDRFVDSPPPGRDSGPIIAVTDGRTVHASKAGNFCTRPASKPMSSVSGAQYEADLPPQSAAVADAAAAVPADRAEIDLMRKAQHGDRGAYGRLVGLYQDRLYNAILRMVGEPEEARDLAQETFTRGLDKLDGFRGDASPYTWLFRIATNLSISRLRKVQRHRTFSLDAPGGPGSTGRGTSNDDQASALVGRMASTSTQPGEDVERRERNQKVLEALGRLDAEYRAVLVMRDIEGFDYQQMADVLGLPLGTLKSRLFRARLALRDELKAYMT